MKLNFNAQIERKSVSTQYLILKSSRLRPPSDSGFEKKSERLNLVTMTFTLFVKRSPDHDDLRFYALSRVASKRITSLYYSWPFIRVCVYIIYYLFSCLCFVVHGSCGFCFSNPNHAWNVWPIKEDRFQVVLMCLMLF